MPLGLFDAPDLADITLELGPGDTIVFYSDGVTEARRARDELGVDRLSAIVRDAEVTHAAGLVDHVHAAVAEFRDGPLHDDTAVLVVRLPDQPVRRQ